MSIEQNIKDGMRQFLADKGKKVRFEDSRGLGPEVSIYGWNDYDASCHLAGREWDDKTDKRRNDPPCHWVIPEGTTVTEETYSQFRGTFTGNDDEVGIYASGVSCACGKYKNVTIRVTSSLGEAIQALLGYDPTKEIKL